MHDSANRMEHTAQGALDSTAPHRAERFRRVAVLGLVLSLLLLPASVYVLTFGVRVTSDHQRWAEMGSAMSGLYTPILSVLTLAVLALQVKLQRDLNRHQFDQSFVLQARADVDFYLREVESELRRGYRVGVSVQQFLDDRFGALTYERLHSDRAGQLAYECQVLFPKLLASWTAYYSLLIGLSARAEHPYSLNFVASKQKAVALLSYGTCVALDHFVWLTSKGQLEVRYQFSSHLTATRANRSPTAA